VLWHGGGGGRGRGMSGLDLLRVCFFSVMMRKKKNVMKSGLKNKSGG